jgi:hypothetical protein
MIASRIQCQRMPSATKNLFEKRFLDFQKLLLIKINVLGAWKFGNFCFWFHSRKIYYYNHNHNSLLQNFQISKFASTAPKKKLLLINFIPNDFKFPLIEVLWPTFLSRKVGRRRHSFNKKEI